MVIVAIAAIALIAIAAYGAQLGFHDRIARLSLAMILGGAFGNLVDPALAGPGIPTSVLYDATGREIARLYGAADWSSPEARALIAAVIKPQR